MPANKLKKQWSYNIVFATALLIVSSSFDGANHRSVLLNSLLPKNHLITEILFPLIIPPHECLQNIYLSSY